MHLKLNYVLPCIAAGGAHENGHAFINDFFAVHDMPIDHKMAGRRHNSLSAGGAKKLEENRYAVFPGNA